MNLVTAVLVEDAIEAAKMDEAMEVAYMRKRIKVLAPEIRRVFSLLDTSNDGKISFKELDFSEIPLPGELASIIQSEKLKDLFYYLDADHSAYIFEREFLEGVCLIAL